MEWNEYLSYLLTTGEDLADFSISLDGGHTKTEIPPIVRASIYMLDKMIENQGRLNILVFPEKVQSIFIFILMKLIHNISTGKISGNYDPTGFQPGEKLKVGNAIVEYLGISEIKGKTYLSIKLADLDLCSAPLADLPIFQKVTTKRRLSKYAKYNAEKKQALCALKENLSGSQKLSSIANMKTHMDSSVFAMTSVTGIKEQLGKCLIDGKKVSDIFYIGQTDYEGKISNISPGQMSGIPAIVFSSDLYSIDAAVTKENPIQSIIIDGSNVSSLLDQLDVLDNLIQRNVPVVCITDVANSFDLQPFAARNFNIWRWDKESITPQLYDAVPLSSDKKIRNSVKHNVMYLKADGSEISEAMRLLSLHRKETESQSSQMMKLFERLNNLTFSALRTTIPVSATDLDVANKTLNDCQTIIDDETAYISENTINDYRTIIDCLKNIYSSGFVPKKIEMLQAYLKEHNSEDVFLIIPEKSPKGPVQDFWSFWCMRRFIKAHVRVLYPSEYYSWPLGKENTTIICGWLKRAIMRRIIFSYNTSNYIIFLYDYEERWKNHDAMRWRKALDSSGNRNIIEKSFTTDQIKISTVRYDKKTIEQDPMDISDELSEIELILRENKYRQFIKNGNRSESDTVTAIPVNFVGGYLAFYRTGHKVLSATKIILYDAEKIETKFPSELRVGDFIVVRESDKDLVKDMADIILKNSGKEHLRGLASKWREALKIELLFCSTNEFCEKMKAAGCNKGIPTIKRWIEDEDVIAPQSRQDLQILAELTENETLLELLDSVFEAAKVVRNAHVTAGRKLSEQLKRTLAQELKEYENLDPYNIWGPIEMNVEGIGTVKVLKIIDIGTELEMEPGDTNRLIEE